MRWTRRYLRCAERRISINSGVGAEARSTDYTLERPGGSTWKATVVFILVICVLFMSCSSPYSLWTQGGALAPSTSTQTAPQGVRTEPLVWSEPAGQLTAVGWPLTQIWPSPEPRGSLFHVRGQHGARSFKADAFWCAAYDLCQASQGSQRQLGHTRRRPPTCIAWSSPHPRSVLVQVSGCGDGHGGGGGWRGRSRSSRSVSRSSPPRLIVVKHNFGVRQIYELDGRMQCSLVGNMSASWAPMSYRPARKSTGVSACSGWSAAARWRFPVWRCVQANLRDSASQWSSCGGYVPPSTRRPPSLPPLFSVLLLCSRVRLRSVIGRELGGSMATWRSLGHSLDGPAVSTPWFGQPSHVEGGCSAPWSRLPLLLAYSLSVVSAPFRSGAVSPPPAPRSGSPCSCAGSLLSWWWYFCWSPG